MSDFLGLDTSGVPELMRVLSDMPTAIQDAVIPDMAEYLRDRMRQYSPYQYVSYKSAYGGWKSDKQRRYVMAAIRRGDITPGVPRRTQTLANGWQVIGNDRNAILANEVPYSPYVQGESSGQQARLPALAGWQGIDKVIPQEDNNLLKRAIRATNRAIRKLGLKTSGE